MRNSGQLRSRIQIPRDSVALAAKRHASLICLPVFLQSELLSVFKSMTPYYKNQLIMANMKNSVCIEKLLSVKITQFKSYLGKFGSVSGNGQTWFGSKFAFIIIRKWKLCNIIYKVHKCHYRKRCRSIRWKLFLIKLIRFHCLTMSVCVRSYNIWIYVKCEQ